MITFNNKRQAFIKMMREKMPVESTSRVCKTECVSDEKADDELMALLEKKFDELFGSLDDDE